MYKRRPVYRGLWLCCLLSLLCAGQTPEELWQGTLNAGGASLRLILHVVKSADGSLSGQLDIPDQATNSIPLNSITQMDRTLRFEIKPMGVVYEGTIDQDQSAIVGKWTGGAGALDVTFKRIEKIPQINRPQNPVKPYPYDEEEVSYENSKAGVKLAGTLTLPRAKGPFPAVLLITGSGPQDRDETLLGHRPFLVLADYLTRKGIAVLRVDDRGTGKSTGDFAKGTTEDFASDARTSVDYLKNRKEIDPARLGLIGHSEGGIIAPMLASQSSDIAFIVMMAGSAETGEKVLLSQAETIGRAAGSSKEAVAGNRAIQQGMFAIVEQEKDFAAADKKLREFLAKSAPMLPKQQSEMQIRMANSPWFRFFLKYDPAPALAKVKCPVLALNGELDLQVSAKENLPAIAAALESGGNPDYEIVKLPKLNHLLQTARTGSIAEYGSISETIAPEALELMTQWILRHTAR